MQEVNEKVNSDSKYVSEFAPSQNNQAPASTENTADTQVAKVTTQENVAKNEFAGVVRRWAASVLDGLIIAAVGAILGIPLGIFQGITAQQNQAGLLLMQRVINTTYVLIAVGYYIYFIGKKGQTLGKMALGIKVIKESTGAPPGYARAFLREFVGKFLSGIVFGLGYFWAIWDVKKQAWHDKIASTLVVKT